MGLRAAATFAFIALLAQGLAATAAEVKLPTLLSAKGLQVVGLLPGELQSWFVNTAGISAAAKQPDAAKALIKYLATLEAPAVIKARGMEPLGK